MVKRTVRFVLETCGPDLTCWRGSAKQLAPADLARLLCQTMPLYLIVDCRRLGTLPPEDVAATAYLFDWLDAAAAEWVSPVLVAGSESSVDLPLVSGGWGKDAVICLFSRQDKGAVLDHLRHCLRPDKDPDGQARGVLAFCWPSALAPLLSSGTAGFARQFMAGIDAALVEQPGDPRTWLLYGRHSLATTLAQLGLVAGNTETTNPEQAAI